MHIFFFTHAGSEFKDHLFAVRSVEATKYLVIISGKHAFLESAINPTAALIVAPEGALLGINLLLIVAIQHTIII